MFENPFVTESINDEINERLINLGMYRWSHNNTCIMAPTKCGSTSVRSYIVSQGIPDNKLKWDDAGRRILIVRHPWQRYYSGLREMLKWPDNMNGDASRDSWKNVWHDHLSPIYTHLWNSEYDFKIIQMDDLKHYIGNIHENKDKKLTSGRYEHITKEYMDHSPWVQLHIARDYEWLKQETIHYNKIIKEKQQVPVPQWINLFKKSA